MSEDTLDVNPESPDAAPAPIAAAPKPAFVGSPEHSALLSFIEAHGGFGTARLSQLVDEIADLLK